MNENTGASPPCPQQDPSAGFPWHKNALEGYEVEVIEPSQLWKYLSEIAVDTESGEAD